MGYANGNLEPKALIVPGHHDTHVAKETEPKFVLKLAEIMMGKLIIQEVQSCSQVARHSKCTC